MKVLRMRGIARRQEINGTICRGIISNSLPLYGGLTKSRVFSGLCFRFLGTVKAVKRNKDFVEVNCTCMLTAIDMPVVQSDIPHTIFLASTLHTSGAQN